MLRSMAGNKKAKRKSAGTNRTPLPINLISFRYAPTDNEKLKSMPRQRMIELRQIGTKTALRDVYFRIIVCKQLARRFVTQDLSDHIDAAINAVRAIEARANEVGHWTPTTREADDIEVVLDLADQMQDQTTRREQAPAFFEASKIVLAHMPA
jgi:hypothetical protein